MDLSLLIRRVRANTRDFTNSIFREEDIINYINEGIERISTIPELQGMVSLNNVSDAPNLLPNRYHHLLSTYATARCFEQDERHYESSRRMNEFEVKMGELREAIDSGDVIVTTVDPITGEEYEVENNTEHEYVVNVYYGRRDIDIDDGVDGVE